MANEINVRVGLSIRKVSGVIVLIDKRYQAAFNLDLTGVKGPTPGALTIPTGGKVVSFAELSTVGVCVFKNMDSVNYVEVGPRDPDTNKFYPFLEIGPGEEWAVKLSRNLLEEYIGTGTGTSSATNQIFMKANSADVSVSVEAYER